jgi:hypothetical protein
MKIKVCDVEFECQFDVDERNRVENLAVFVGEDGQEIYDLLDKRVQKKIEDAVAFEAAQPQGPEDDPRGDR